VPDQPDATVAFADLVGYTAATEAHGDALAVALSRRLTELASDALRGGSELVKTVGDAVMLTGPDPADMVESIRNLLVAVVREPAFPLVRAGAHWGPVIPSEGDLFGAAVNLAARVVNEAAPMQVVVTRELYERLRVDVAATSLGRRPLRNVTEEVELLELDLGYTAGTWSVDPVCRMRVDSPTLTVIRDGVTFSFCSDACKQRFA